MQGHLNFHHSTAYEPKIASHHLLQQLATKGLSKVPGAAEIIAKNFTVKQSFTPLKPPPPKNLVYHSGHGTV